MRYKFICVFLWLVISIASYAQAVDKRTLQTKIADVLATLPAQNKEQLSKSMDQISSMGKEGITEMTRMLGRDGDLTALEYALSGYAFYVTQKGKDTERKNAVTAFCSAIDKLSLERQIFIIQQLQIVGKDEAVGCLRQLLQKPSTTGTAAVALAQINTTLAEKTLLTALQTTKGDNRIALIEALGFVQYQPAVLQLHALAKSATGDLKMATHYALAKIGDPSSATLLADAARKTGYTYENSQATMAYLIYLRRLAANGNKTVAANLAAKLMQQVPDSNSHARIAALKVIMDINQTKSLPLLYAAMKDPDPEYRVAAFQFSAPYMSPEINREWVRTIPSVDKNAQILILQALSQTNDKSLYPVYIGYLQNDDKEIRMAAVSGAAKFGQQQALPRLISMLQTVDSAELSILKDAILQIEGPEVTSMLIGQLNTLPAKSKIVVMEILAARAADNAVDALFNQINQADTHVQQAAIRALPYVVSGKDAPKLYPLLMNAKPGDVSAIQQAIIRSIKDDTDSATQVRTLIREMNNAGREKQHYFLHILASVGGNDALNAVENAYRNGDAQTKQAAVSALAASNSKKAASSLLQIARNDLSNKEAALNSYLNIISRAPFTPAQKVIMLQDAMEIAVNDNQRRRIIREAARAGTFTALIFTGNYLNHSSLQQDAANAVMNITLANKKYNGDMVRGMIMKTIEVMKGQDSDYQREALRKHLEEMDPGPGFISLFNGKDLTGWKGLVADPVKRAKMDAATLHTEQVKSNKLRDSGWSVKDGLLIFNGHGNNLATDKQYGDFEMFVDWKITKDGDAGIYLRGSPQVQIWDTSRTSSGAQVGSGGLYNNQKNPAKPLVVADNAVGEWNNFHIIMRGDRVTVYLNGQLVTDNVVMENYWDRSIPIYPKEQIELQAHGTYVAYRNIYLKELQPATAYKLPEQEVKEGFTVLFDGTNLDNWIGNKIDYQVDNGELLVKPQPGSHGNLYSKDEFSDFVLRFEFQLTPGANNGLGIRTPAEGDAAYEGMELQILDNEAEIYKNLQPYQYHGSVYGVIPARRGFLKPVGEWNTQEVYIKGSKVKVILNNQVILDGDIAEASKNGTVDKREHPGLNRKKGHIGFLGHGSVVRFRNIRIKEL